MKITIVTPTLNAMAHLEDCLASVRRNESPAVTVEHVIADGGSTDGTVELAKSDGCTVLTGKDKGIFDASHSYRRTGLNHSAVHPANRTRKSPSVRSIGPTSSLETVICRYFVKTWFHAVNPSWSLCKWRNRLEAKVSPNQPVYF